MTSHRHPLSRRWALLFLAVAGVGLLTSTGCLDKKNPTVKGAISGKVFDSNGHALRGAIVAVYGFVDVTTTTDELGRFFLANVPPGEVKLVATHDGRSVTQIVQVERGETLENVIITFSVVDGLPPIITDVAVTAITENTVTISWRTNEAADSIIQYATGPIGLGNWTWLATDSAMVLVHSLTLRGLDPGRTYHFQVKSRDFAGNEGVSSQHEFTTASGDAPATPANLVIAPPTEMERVTLTWTSNTEADLRGYNLYRAESKDGPFVRVNADPIANAASTTTYTDTGRAIAQKYYYRLAAVDTANNESVPTTVLSITTPGSLRENRTWGLAESPYVLDGDLRVAGGAVLTIEPGVEVKFGPFDHLPDVNGAASATELLVQGGLHAVGTVERRIVFTSAATFPQKGIWGGIRYLSTIDANNLFKYATLIFADTGIRSEGSTPVIENSEIGLCIIGLDLGLSTALNVRFNLIRDCNVGLVSAGSNITNNIFINDQTAIGVLGRDLITHNTIDCLLGIEILGGEPTIKNNILAWTGTTAALYGINQKLPLATPTISFNDIYNYTFATNDLTVATGPGNIASNPLFIGGSPYDYRLQTIAGGYASDSPCLTAGEGGVQMGRYGP